MASITRDTRRYEDWLRGQCRVVEHGLEAKHERMRKSAFDFLRATYYRWARTVADVCPECLETPPVLCVGDIHVENYGTWRDADSRLVWGINDFDEAAPMPYATDLIRLTTSAFLVPGIGIAEDVIATSVLKGYVDGLSTRRPRLLEQGAPWLREIVDRLNVTSDKFWGQLEAADHVTPPPGVRRALRSSLPKGAKVEQYLAYQKGGGSLGRPRFALVAQWQGGKVVRDAKALVPSAWSWATGEVRKRSRYLDVLCSAYRSPDPSIAVSSGFLVRRISPDERKLDLEDVTKRGLGTQLLKAMGADLAAVHAAHRNVNKVIEDLAHRDVAWLQESAAGCRAAVVADYTRYREG